MEQIGYFRWTLSKKGDKMDDFKSFKSKRKRGRPRKVEIPSPPKTVLPTYQPPKKIWLIEWFITIKEVEDLLNGAESAGKKPEDVRVEFAQNGKYSYLLTCKLTFEAKNDIALD